MNKTKNENQLTKKIIFEFEKDNPDYNWLCDNLKECFLIDKINAEWLDRTGTALMFYFVNYKKIKNKKIISCLLNNSNLNFYNVGGFNSVFSYFRNAREKGIKLNDREINKILKNADFTSTSKDNLFNVSHNLFQMYVNYDYGHTVLNNKNQILFLKKVKEVDSYRRCAEALMWPIKHGLNDEEKGKTIKTIASFNFELPEVRDFFDKAKEYIMNNYGEKGREIYRYLDNLIIASSINEKTNNPIKKSKHKI